MLNLRSLVTALALAAVLSPAAYAAYSDKTFTVSNTGNGALTITGAAISGNTAEYALTGNTCTSVAPGGNCTMTVRFTPSGGNARPAAALNFTSNGTNGPSHSIALSGSGAACAAGKQVFSYTGADQVITVPAGCSTATIKAWGAGGKAGYYAAGGTGGAGGGGGFAQRAVTGLASGSTLVVVVGQGATGTASTYGGGGAGTHFCIIGCADTGAGGGLSGVFSGVKSQANSLLVAGGGGGTYLVAAGAGGGAAGSAGTAYSTYSPGQGGSQVSGGAGGGNSSVGFGTTGSALQGGTGTGTLGFAGGGGGYWGGGGSYYAGAGGGSGYAPGGTLVSGSGCAVANSGDSDYVSGVGNGGCSPNAVGQNGRVVIQWGP